MDLKEQLKTIDKILENTIKVNEEELKEILDKALLCKGLTLEDTAKLLISDNKYNDKIFEVAGEIKKDIYGDRVVMFAPLYISNYCVNNCHYCGFSHKNNIVRKKLTMDEIKKEIKILEKMGHKRLALEVGEDFENCSMDYILECIKTIYGEKTKNGEIRRLNINIAATSVDNYKKLKEADIGTYILFQETYNETVYKDKHTSGPKSNFDFHLTAMNRALEGGIDDIGGGVLFGLYDYMYEVLGLLTHTNYLEKKYGVGFHTISVPRLCEAEGYSKDEYSYLVDDNTFKKIIAIIRLAVPYTGIIISTRETKEMRKELINIGVSQLSAGSSVEVGGYSLRENENKNKSQFELNDHRTALEINKWLLEEDLIPSFCTACYRQGRTGDRFMELAKSKNIKNVCLPNGLLTLKEYSLDYGDNDFKIKVDEIIKNKINNISSDKVKELTKTYLHRLENGERDLYL